MHRPVSHTDPDGVTSFTYYNVDGSVSKTETAYQHLHGAGVTFTYDPDADEVKEVHHYDGYNASTGAFALVDDVTRKWYDGEDRLVEVELPYGSANPLSATGPETYTNPWITRYLYDLSDYGSSSGGTATYQGIRFNAYGNLFKTQELLPANAGQITAQNGQVANTQFQDTKGTAFDALDRPTTKYTYVNNAPRMESMTYDGSAATYGLLNSDCSALGVCISYSYDNAGRVATQHASDGSFHDRTLTYDPDGRLASDDDNGVLGQETFSFDADGRQTVKHEAPGVSSPAVITHEFYPDGTMRQIDVSSSGLTQKGLFVYSRRADGAVQTEQINYAALTNVGTTTLSKTYSRAGRFQQQTSAGPAAAPIMTRTFDIAADNANGTNTGLLTAETFGSQTVNGFLFDYEGEMLQDSVQENNRYTVRGELLEGSFANGVQASGGTTTSTIGNTTRSHTSTWNGLQGALLSASSSITSTAKQTSSSNSVTVTFDDAGRAIQSVSATDSEDASGNGGTTSNDTKRSFDAQNRLVGSSLAVTDKTGYVTTFTQAAYIWGPDGHPHEIGIGKSNHEPFGVNATPPPIPSYDSLHWDGDTLLFETDSAGNVDEVPIGTAGAILPRDTGYSGLTWFNRSPSGIIIACANATGLNATTLYGAAVTSKFSCSNTGTVAGSMPSFITRTPPQDLSNPVTVGNGGVLKMPRPDGIFDGVNTVQGVRTYDEGTRQWTSPDAFEGNVHDPMSQKSYMWNANNAVSYADSTGYFPGGGGEQHDSRTGFWVTDDTTGEVGDMDPGTSSFASQLPRSDNEIDAGMPDPSAISNLVDGTLAAFAAGNRYNPLTMRDPEHDEYGGQTYRNSDGSLGYTVNKGDSNSVDVDGVPIPEGARETGTWHTHGPGVWNETFSDGDFRLDQRSDKVNGFLITPSGALKVDLFMNYPFPYYSPNIVITICAGCVAH